MNLLLNILVVITVVSAAFSVYFMFKTLAELKRQGSSGIPQGIILVDREWVRSYQFNDSEYKAEVTWCAMFDIEQQTGRGRKNAPFTPRDIRAIMRMRKNLLSDGFVLDGQGQLPDKPFAYTRSTS